jgi:predicted phosphodiesterase
LSKLTRKVLVIPDTHFPFEDKNALEKLFTVAKDFKPDLVIQIGDLYDMFAYSKYANGISVMTPKDESDRARVCAERMWSRVRKACPNARCVQLVGNHDERPLNKILEKCPENEHVAKSWLLDQMSFDGVETILDPKEEFIYDGVCYMHGFRKFGEHATFNQMNTVTGHLHRGAVQWNQNVDGSYFELNVGMIADKNSPALHYKSQNRISKMTVGFGMIDRLGPRFVSLE